MIRAARVGAATDVGIGRPIGLVEWFEVGEHERVERVLASLRAIGASRLRTGISWADWYAEGGEAWYAWLLPTLARHVEVLPCFLYTPPSIGVAPKTSAPPRRPREYADVLDVILDRVGEHFEWVELWNEPNNLSEWDWTLDPRWEIFTTMVTDAAHWARVRGKKTVLGGMSPIDPAWLALVWDRGLVDHLDAVGIHGFPGTWERTWPGWEQVIARVREVWKDRATSPELWITEVGYSTWSHDEIGQAERFLHAMDSGVERVYWYGAEDLDPGRSTVDGFHTDEREYHFGLWRPDGSPKLLARLLEDGGIASVRDIVRRSGPRTDGEEGEASASGAGAPAVHTNGPEHTLITGGSGFIGTNLADRLLEAGHEVHLLDNLSRPGVERNLRHLQERHRGVAITVGDVRNPHVVARAVERAERIVHLAAQVAVTTSLETPGRDFDVNAGGTLNLLRAAASRDHPPAFLFASTNKVYGGIEELSLRSMEKRYEPVDEEVWAHGISEASPLRFRSPYGCSKGSADQYVLDFARTFGLPTVVFRLSCVYGPRQLGTEDQGWVSHFVLRAIEGLPVTLFGDGRQVRDILYVGDLVDAVVRTLERIDDVRGEAFNVGGGPERAVSLLELFDVLESLGVARPRISFERVRPGDQRYYVTDLRKVERALDWSPAVSVQEGLRRLLASLEPSGRGRGGGREGRGPPAPGRIFPSKGSREASR